MFSLQGDTSPQQTHTAQAALPGDAGAVQRRLADMWLQIHLQDMESCGAKPGATRDAELQFGNLFRVSLRVPVAQSERRVSASVLRNGLMYLIGACSQMV